MFGALGSHIFPSLDGHVLCAWSHSDSSDIKPVSIPVGSHGWILSCLVGGVKPNRFLAGIGLKGGGIHADPLAPQQLLRRQDLQHLGEHRRVHRKRKTPSSLADGGMIRGGHGQAASDKAPQTQGVGHAPGDLPLAWNPLEVAQHQQSEVNPRGQTRLADALSVVGQAKLFTVTVKPMDFEHLLQTRIKRVGSRGSTR